MHLSRMPLLAPCLIALAVGPAPAAEPVPPEKYERLRALIKPTAKEEAWASLPWQTSLWEARRLAARQGKPVLLWQMDGNPLGCT